MRRESPALSTVALIFIIVTGLTTLLLAGPGNDVDVYPNSHANRVALLLYLIPSQLPLSVPVRLGAALIAGLRATRVRAGTLVLIVAVAAAHGLTMFANMEWLVPNSNQAFREEAMGRPLARGQLRIVDGRPASATRLGGIRTALNGHSSASGIGVSLSLGVLGSAGLRDGPGAITRTRRSPPTARPPAC